MKHRDLWTNAVLLVLVAVLAVICIRSVVHEQRRADNLQEQKDGRQ